MIICFPLILAELDLTFSLQIKTPLNHKTKKVVFPQIFCEMFISLF